MVEIAEHSVELSLLPERANILDLGCRGFAFTDYFRKKGHIVHAVDIDDLKGYYFQCAILDYNGRIGIHKDRDPQATRVKEGDDIVCYTLETFSKLRGVEFWDLIKMDIEMAEYQVILDMKKPMAKQLSIEFHLHYGEYGQNEMIEMEAKLFDLGYRIYKHNLEERYGAGYNYWDSLFILK